MALIPQYDENGMIIGYEDTSIYGDNDLEAGDPYGGDPFSSSSSDNLNLSDYFKTLPDVYGTGSFGDIVKGIGSLFAGTSSLGKGGQLAGLLGAAALANKMFGNSGSGGFAGYQGKIPTYLASRTMNAIPTTMTVPKTGGGTEVVPRRPGSGGITYFSPMVYTPAPITTVAGGGGNDTTTGGGGSDTVIKASGGMVQGYAPGGIVSLTKTPQTPYQIYDAKTGTYSYTDAPGFERFQQGIPLTPINRVPGSPVYYGSSEAPARNIDTSGNNPITMQDNSLDIQDFNNTSNPHSFFQALQNEIYAPEGLIANEVVNRAVEEYPSVFDPRNVALRNENDAMMSRALNQFLGDVMSVDQITGDVDPIQSLRNIAAYEPSLVEAAPGIRDLQSTISDLSPVSYEARRGISAPYVDQLSPEDIRSIQAFGQDYRNVFGSIADVLENKSILPSDYTDNVVESTPTYVETPSDTQQPSIFQMEDYQQTPEYSIYDDYGLETGDRGGGGGKRGGAVTKNGIASLMEGHLGSYSDGGRLLRGPGDGVSDDIPATIGNKQPARLADGEFVIPARIVSELGNGSTEAGARKLYAMMDRIKKARRSTKDIAADTKTDRYLPR